MDQWTSRDPVARSAGVSQTYALWRLGTQRHPSRAPFERIAARILRAFEEVT